MAFATLVPKHMDHTQASLLDHREVARYLESDLKFGLVTAEVQQRLKRFGLNKLDPQPTAGETAEAKFRHFKSVRRLAKQLHYPLPQLLIIAIILSSCLRFYENSVAISLYILLVCLASYLQERRVDADLEELSLQVPSTCQVIRDRQLLELETELLVPGDIVHLHEGQRVPADVRLFEAHSLKVDEENLTGDSRPQRKFAEPLAAPVRTELTRKSVRFFSDFELASTSSEASSGYASTSVEQQQPRAAEASGESEKSLHVDGNTSELSAERTIGAEKLRLALVAHEQPQVAGTCAMHQNLALMGSRVEAGHSMGVVIATGQSTRYSSEVYRKLKMSRENKTPLQTQVDELSLSLLISAFIAIALGATLAIIQQRAPLEVSYYALALACLAAPAGLPVVVTLEARGVAHKVQSFLTYHIAINSALLVLVTISYGTNTDTPYNLMQLLYANLIANGLIVQALATGDLSERELGFWPDAKESAEDRALLNCRMLGSTFLLATILIILNGGLYDYLLDSSGHLDGRARALLFACFVFCTIFASLGLKSQFKTVYETRLHGNRQLLACCAIMAPIQVVITQVAPLNGFFGLEAVSALELVYVFAYSALVLLVMDGLKLFVRLLEFSGRLLLKLAANLQVPTGREGSYSTARRSKSGAKFAANADQLAKTTARRPPARCMAVTPLPEHTSTAANQSVVVATLPTRTLFGNTFRR